MEIMKLENIKNLTILYQRKEKSSMRRQWLPAKDLPQL